MRADRLRIILWGATAVVLAGAVFPTLSEFSVPDTAPAPLVVMSFNIRFDNPADRANPWAKRKDKVAGTIDFFRTDAAGLQEALINQIQDLESLLPDYRWLGAGRSDGRNLGEFCPVFYRSSRLVPVRHGTFWLSETPDVPGSRGWDAALSRIATWVEFRDLATGGYFAFFNAHFDHVGETARMESARLLLAKIRELAPEGPVVVAGDFNCRESDAPLRLLVSEGESQSALANSRDLSLSPPYGSSSTFNGFRNIILPGRRIDHIFVRNAVSVRRWGVISDRWDGLFVSDHNAVLAEIVFEETRRP